MSNIKYRSSDDQELVFNILLDEESPLTKGQIAQLKEKTPQELLFSLLDEFGGYAYAELEFEDQSEIEQMGLACIHLANMLSMPGITVLAQNALREFKLYCENNPVIA
jgi:hypothetical protein